MKKVNSKYIAEKAGVSRSTVSKVINGYSSISEGTKLKVLKAIEEAEYTPDISGRILAGKGSDTLAFFLFDRGNFSTDLLVNSLISAMIDVAAEHDFHILSYIFRYPVSHKTEKDARDVFAQRRADAAVIVGARDNEPIIEDLIHRGNIVSIYDHEITAERINNRIIVNMNDEETAFKCMKYLYGMGHRSIGILNGDMERHGGVAKRDGFNKGIREFSLNTKDEWIISTDFSKDSGYSAMKELLLRGGELPSAFAVANDSIAFGAMKAISEAGLSIPDDISLIATDDHPLSAYVRPGLTTFNYDLHELADRLVSSAITAIKSKHSVLPDVPLMESVLIERESCRRIL